MMDLWVSEALLEGLRGVMSFLVWVCKFDRVSGGFAVFFARLLRRFRMIKASDEGSVERGLFGLREGLCKDSEGDV